MVIWILVCMKIEAHNPWSIRTYSNSDVVDIGLGYLEDVVVNKAEIDNDIIINKIMNMKSQERYGIGGLIHLFQGKSEREAVEYVIYGYLNENCTFCASFLGFLTATGFFRGVGASAWDSELIRNYQLRFPITTAYGYEAQAAAWLYKEALEFGSTDPLALLGYLNSQDENILCDELIGKVSQLADTSIENAVSMFPRPRRVQSIDELKEFSYTTVKIREEKLRSIINSGELMVGPEEGEETAFAMMVPEMMEELKHRVPEAEHSRVFKALKKYMQDGQQTGSVSEAVRDLLDLIKRNAVIRVYNVALEEKEKFCVDSIRVFRRLITEHNRFARLLFSLSAFFAERGDSRRTFLAQTLLGQMYAPALMNAADFISGKETPLPDSWTPTEYLQVTPGRISDCSGEELFLEQSEISCESLCIQHAKCNYVLQSTKCRFFSTCPEESEISNSSENLLLRRQKEHMGNSIFFMNTGARRHLLHEVVLREDLRSALEALLALGREALLEGRLRDAYDHFKEASDDNEEARFEVAMLEFQNFHEHVVNKSFALSNLYNLIFLPSTDPYERSDELFDKVFEEEWGILLFSDLGEDVLELVDVSFPPPQPTSTARRLAAAIAFLYMQFIENLATETVAAFVLTSVAIGVLTKFLSFRL